MALAVARRLELEALAASVRVELASGHKAREVAIAACRQVIQACAASIRSVHRLDFDGARDTAAEAMRFLRLAQEALAPHPSLAASGPLHDAEKEYAEARLTAALVTGAPLPGPEDLGVAAASWLGGLAEAASELRRHILDRLREGPAQQDRAEELLAAMDDVYGVLITIDFPDAVTGGLRRTTDALRAVLERTRGDVTTTVLQARLMVAIERHMPPGAAAPSERGAAPE